MNGCADENDGIATTTTKTTTTAGRRWARARREWGGKRAGSTGVAVRRGIGRNGAESGGVGHKHESETRSKRMRGVVKRQV